MQLALALAMYLSTSATSSRVPESTILGAWCAGSKNAFHEEFSLDIDEQGHSFYSWLHERPAFNGSWELRGRVLTIHGRSGDTMVYRVITATKRRLVLREQDRSDSETYVRIGHCLAFGDP